MVSPPFLGAIFGLTSEKRAGARACARREREKSTLALRCAGLPTRRVPPRPHADPPDPRTMANVGARPPPPRPPAAHPTPPAPHVAGTPTGSCGTPDSGLAAITLLAARPPAARMDVAPFYALYAAALAATTRSMLPR